MTTGRRSCNCDLGSVRMQIDGSDLASATLPAGGPFSIDIQLTNKLSMCEWQGNEYISGFSVCEMRKSCLAHYVNNVIMQRTLRSSIQHVSKDEINVSHSIPTYSCWSLHYNLLTAAMAYVARRAVKHPTENTKQTRAQTNNDDDDNDQRKFNSMPQRRQWR